MLVNLEEVARLAGVSRSTVSRVVNGDRRVSPAVRERVQAVVREHGYHPHAAARSLASRRTRILGLLIAGDPGFVFGDPYFATLVRAVAAAAGAADHDLMLLTDPPGDPGAAERRYRRVIGGRHLDGVVVASAPAGDPFVARLLADGFPAVQIGRQVGPGQERARTVDVDNRAAALGAVDHLLAHGRRRVAHIGGPGGTVPGRDRAAGYRDALRAAGLPVVPARCVEADFTRAGGERAMRALLADASPRRAVPP